MREHDLSEARHKARHVLGQARRSGRSAIRTLSGRRPGQLDLVCFHRVAVADVDPWSMAMAPDEFDAAVSMIARRGPIVTLEDELERGRASISLARTTRSALTFDDGYVDNLTTMVPIIERHDAPCTVFVATAFLDRPYFWWDRLAELAYDEAWTHRPHAVTGIELLDGSTTDTTDPDQRHLALYERLVWSDPAAIDEAIEALDERLGRPARDHNVRPLTTDELVRLDQHPLVTIGNHTARHRRLSSLSADEVAAEIAEGAASLDAILGPADRLLAYPYGDVSTTVTRVAKRLGVRWAVTTEQHSIVGPEHPLRLPRHDLASLSITAQ